MRTIAAEAVVAAAPQEVFAFLSDLENHWELADGVIEVVSLDRASPDSPAHGGRVRVRGPLGTRRTATTRVVSAEPHHLMRGTAELGGGTRAQVQWTLTPDGSWSRVRLAAELEHAGRLDRLLLKVGGWAWLQRRFASILATLAARFRRS